jgi:diguanylate cyclase (GGDEF)-like protein
MNLLSIFKDISIINPSLEKHTPNYLKIVLLNIILVASGLLFFVFGFYYFFVQSLHLLGLVMLFSSILILYALYRVRYKGNITVTTTLVIITVFGVLLAIILLKKAEHFTLIWTIFVPIATIFIYGTKIGIRLTIGFYIVAFILTYQGIDIWQDGAWNQASYIRYVLASILLTIMVYILELSLENAFNALEEKIEQEKSYIKKLTQFSITDPLTKLYNRRYLNEVFIKNFKVAEKNEYLYVFVILDLDYFKKYNDTYGHKEGDEVLVKVSKILTDNLRRDSDYAFRVGGEEFAYLILAKEEECLFTFIEKVRQEIEDTKLITASFGVCIIDNYENNDFDEMYREADKFLYEAKDKGRNQVIGGIVKLKPNITSNS